MASDFIFPDSIELREIAQVKMPRLEADRPIFAAMPTREVDDWVVSWEQLDNYMGLQQVRGIDGAPPKIKKTGFKRYLVDPGVYGEFEQIDERELTRRRQIGNLSAPVDISDLVMQAQDKLLQRRLDRIEYIYWTLLTTGTFSVTGPNGSVLHTDAYTTQSFTASVSWATAATATPLNDFRQVKLKHRGISVRLDNAAVAYMNSTTANNMYNNTNNADLYGRRTQGLGTFNSLDQINTLMTGDNLPRLQEYDEGYYDDGGTFHTFIPDNKVVVIGQRPAGQALGEWIYARNANNPGMGPGAYQRVIDRGEDTVPRSIEVHDGMNAAVALYYPSAIVVMSV